MNGWQTGWWWVARMESSHRGGRWSLPSSRHSVFSLQKPVVYLSLLFDPLLVGSRGAWRSREGPAEAHRVCVPLGGRGPRDRGGPEFRS